MAAARRRRTGVAGPPGRLPLPHGRPHPRGGARTAPSWPGGRRRARRDPPGEGLPRLHHLARLARLQRREAHPPRRRGRRRRVPADQAEGGCRSRGRRTPLPGRPLGGRPRHPDRHRRQPALERGRGDHLDQGPRRVRALLDRGAHQPRRRPRPRHRPRGRRPRQGRHRRTRTEPCRLQTAPPGRRHRRPADRRRPRRRRQREPRHPAPRGQVRRAGLPARGRGRPVRTRPAPVDVRLRGALRHHRRPGHRIRRPSARPLPRPGGDQAGSLHGTHRAGLLRGHAAAVHRGVHLPRRHLLGRRPRPPEVRQPAERQAEGEAA